MASQQWSELASVLSCAAHEGRWSQKRLARACGVSQAAVSKWLGGLQDPSLAHLVLLAANLKLDPVVLASLGGYDAGEVQAVLQVWASPQYDTLMSFVDERLAAIPRIRTNGDPRRAMAIASELALLIDHLVQNTPASVELDMLLFARALALFEQASSAREVYPHLQLPAVTQPLAEEITRIAETSRAKQGDIFNLATISVAHAHYIALRYRSSIDHFSEAILQTNDMDEQLLNLRTLALDFAYLRNMPDEEKRARVCKLERQARERIERSRFDTMHAVATTIEGFARARGLLRLEDGMPIFEEAWAAQRAISSPDERGPLLPIQISISTLEVLARAETNDLINDIEAVGAQIRACAIAAGYDKYGQRVDSILKRVLERKQGADNARPPFAST